jgi:type 1 fimbria pilin
MKKYLAALSATALIGVAPYALAGPSADLRVTGLITPVACTPSLSDGGVIDIGKVPAKNLNMDTVTLVDSRPMQLSVSCTAPIGVALLGIDNNASSALYDNYYGLGFTDDGQKIGMFRPNIKSAQADGQALTPIHSTDIDGPKKSWQLTSYLGKNELTSAGTPRGSSSYTPALVENLTMELEVVTYIAPGKSLTLTEDIKMNGSATFELTYL